MKLGEMARLTCTADYAYGDEVSDSSADELIRVLRVAGLDRYTFMFCVYRYCTDTVLCCPNFPTISQTKGLHVVL